MEKFLKQMRHSSRDVEAKSFSPVKVRSWPSHTISKHTHQRSPTLPHPPPSVVKYARRSSVSRASFVEPTEENQTAATTIQSMVRQRRVHAELMAQEEAAKSIQRAFRKRQANKVHGKKGHAAKVQPNSDGV